MVLKEYLEAVSGLGHKVSQYVLDHGKPGIIDAKSFVGGGIRNHCYMNASKVALKGEGVYVEGFITTSGVPMDHAWIEVNGIVRDPTISYELRYFITEYYGVSIKLEFLLKALLRNKQYGILVGNDNHKAVQWLLDQPVDQVVGK